MLGTYMPGPGGRPGRLGAWSRGDDGRRYVTGSHRLGEVEALTDGYSAAFLGAAGIVVVGALVAAALLRVPKAGAAASDEEVEEDVQLAA